MVYKSKRINRKRYIKRQSRKRMYGGDTQPIDNSSQYKLPPPPEPAPSKEHEILSQVEPPSTVDNLKKGFDIGLQVGNNLAATGLEYLQDGVENLESAVGIDPEKNIQEEVNKIADKTKKLANAFNSPQAKQALENLGNVVGEFSEEVIGPGVTKAVDAVVDNSGPLMNKAVSALEDAAAATPLGPLIELPRLGADIAGIVEDSTAMAADVLNISKDTIEKGKENADKLEGAWSDFQSVIDQGNTAVSSGLNNIQDMVDKSGKSIVAEGMKNMPKVPEMPKVPVLQAAGSSLKKYRRESMMIGGRVNKSQLEFLSPYVNRSQILQQYGGKWQTKRRNRVRRRLTSRRR
jgi:hypothetical protein